MKCPYCGKELESGFLKSSRWIHWGKERALGFVRKDIRVTKNGLDGFFEGHFAEAQYCSACQKIIASIQDTK